MLAASGVDMGTTAMAPHDLLSVSFSTTQDKMTTGMLSNRYNRDIIVDPKRQYMHDINARQLANVYEQDISLKP